MPDYKSLGVRGDMENFAPPPPPKSRSKDPKKATLQDFDVLRKNIKTLKSISGAALLYRGACEGNDSYENNCAHFLSDAFLRAGYADLKVPADCIEARCGTVARRPIRARDMWCWFKQRAIVSQNSLPTGAGYWAVFQLDESAYWGGHVLIYDSDQNIYFGTGHYPNWAQHCYKW